RGRSAEPRAVDEDVDPSPLRDGRGDRVGKGEREGDVAADRQGLAPLPGNVGRDPLAGDLIARGEGHAGAFGREAPADRLADPARGPGPEGALAGEAAAPLPPRRAGFPTLLRHRRRILAEPPRRPSVSAGAEPGCPGRGRERRRSPSPGSGPRGGRGTTRGCI